MRSKRNKRSAISYGSVRVAHHTVSCSGGFGLVEHFLCDLYAVSRCIPSLVACAATSVTEQTYWRGIGNLIPTSREHQTGGFDPHRRRHHFAASSNLCGSGCEWMIPCKEEPPDESTPIPARCLSVPRQFRPSLSSRQVRRGGCNSCRYPCVLSRPRLLEMGEQVHLVPLVPKYGANRGGQTIGWKGRGHA